MYQKDSSLGLMLPVNQNMCQAVFKSLKTQGSYLLCANEFIDQAEAVAIPDIENCLPNLLGISKSVARGYDIDYGA